MALVKPLAVLLFTLSSRACDAFSSQPFRLRAFNIHLPKHANSRSSRVSASVPASLRMNRGSTPETLSINPTPKSKYDSIICGGGPAGLLTCIMLSRKYGPSHRIAVMERRPHIPPSPSDDTVWNDIARFYLLGIGHRGQTALRKFGVFDDFVQASVAVMGRRDWSPGETRVEDGRITPAKKDVVSRILARDKLVGVLHHHLLENYGDADIDMLYGYEVDPVSFGSEEDHAVTVRIYKCKETSNSTVASQDSEQLCDVERFQLATTDLLIGADGSARTIANAMERTDAHRHANLHPIQRLFQKPFKIKRYPDDNPRVYKSVPIRLPPDWPRNLNYSARSTGSRITLEALPSDNQGSYCALLLMKPDDELAQSHVDPSVLRAFFSTEFPQFGALVDEEEMARIATKPSSPLPAFRYAGPRLHMGRTVILGDAAHTVKPYYGLGANTALEDVQILSDALDADAVPRALKTFSEKRAADSQALVVISRNMDRPGNLFFVNFLIPIILDGIFHKIAPQIFGPNIFGMFQKKQMGFKQIQRKKRLDRSMQIACLGGVAVVVSFGFKAMVARLARVVGKSEGVVTGGLAMITAVGVFLSKAASSPGEKEPREARER